MLFKVKGVMKVLRLDRDNPTNLPTALRAAETDPHVSCFSEADAADAVQEGGAAGRGFTRGGSGSGNQHSTGHLHWHRSVHQDGRTDLHNPASG